MAWPWTSLCNPRAATPRSSLTIATAGIWHTCYPILTLTCAFIRSGFPADWTAQATNPQPSAHRNGDGATTHWMNNAPRFSAPVIHSRTSPDRSGPNRQNHREPALVRFRTPRKALTATALSSQVLVVALSIVIHPPIAREASTYLASGPTRPRQDHVSLPCLPE